MAKPGSAVRRGDSPLVLIVEPDPDYRFILTAILNHGGYRVEATGDPAHALIIARARCPTAIIGEHPLLLPDGRRLCEALHDDPGTARIPFLAITSRVLSPEFDHARMRHPSGVLAKPVGHAKVMAALERLVGAPASGLQTR